MKIYIAGPITGKSDYYDVFYAAEELLTDIGYAVMNPAVLPCSGFNHEDYMKITQEMLGACDAIYLLSGWENSKGAKLELYVALREGKRVFLDEVYGRMKK